MITTNHFKIVFPSVIDSDAYRTARLLEKNYSGTVGDLQRPLKRKFPVLLHHLSVISNGYVTLAPRRMELVTIPPPDSYPIEWLSLLTLHELRHAIQLNKLNQGFTGFMGFLTGDIANGIVSAQIPSWFYEGDAVYNETLLSSSGRGRIPGFSMPLRTILLEKPRPYSYNKSLFGSYRNFVPDQYVFGYHMVNYARSAFGNDVWSEALNFTARNPFLIWPLARYFKKNHHLVNSGLYARSMMNLKDQYNKTIYDTNYSNTLQFNLRNHRVYRNYLMPKDAGNGHVLVYRTGLDDPGSFVIIDSTAKEKQLLVTGNRMAGKFDISGNKIAWDEMVSDPRWEQRNYSIIKVMDISNGKQRSLTKKTRYFSPSFSPDGKSIAVAEIDELNLNHLTIIDAASGKQILRLPSGRKSILTPHWITPIEIVAVTVSEHGKQLETVNLQSGMWEVLIPYSSYEISDPVTYKGCIIFHAAFGESDNIYAIDVSKPGSLYQLTHSEFGAFSPSVSRNNQSLFYSDYSAEGHDIKVLQLDRVHWETIDFSRLKLDADIQKQDTSTSNLSYKATPYRKALHLFNLHSWLPFYADIDAIRDDPYDTYISPGVMVFSQNLLSTVISSFSYQFSDGNHYFRPSLRWSGWYPVFEFDARIGGPQRYLVDPDDTEIIDRSTVYSDINLKSYIPLTFSRGRFTTFLQPEVELQRASTRYQTSDGLKKGIYSMHLRLYWSHYVRSSARDIYPRWGQMISATHTESLSGEDPFGNLSSIQTMAFFPGIFRHHHFFARGGYQVQKPVRYYYSINRVDFPRGYNTAVSREFAVLRLNYSFPMAYPDFSLGGVMYLKRLRSNFFYDISYGRDIRQASVAFTGMYKSYGTEIVADMHLFRIIFPISAGVRIGYMPGRNRVFSEMLVNVNTTIF